MILDDDKKIQQSVEFLRFYPAVKSWVQKYFMSGEVQSYSAFIIKYIVNHDETTHCFYVELDRIGWLHTPLEELFETASEIAWNNFIKEMKRHNYPLDIIEVPYVDLSKYSKELLEVYI